MGFCHGSSNLAGRQEKRNLRCSRNYAKPCTNSGSVLRDYINVHYTKEGHSKSILTACRRYEKPRPECHNNTCATTHEDSKAIQSPELSRRDWLAGRPKDFQFAFKSCCGRPGQCIGGPTWEVPPANAPTSTVTWCYKLHLKLNGGFLWLYAATGWSHPKSIPRLQTVQEPSRS